MLFLSFVTAVEIVNEMRHLSKSFPVSKRLIRVNDKLARNNLILSAFTEISFVFVTKYVEA
jgi:hypothetical protein